MNLVQKGYDCDYEMNIFINIFFERNEEGTITTFFNHEKDLITVKTIIDFLGKTYEEIMIFLLKMKNLTRSL